MLNTSLKKIYITTFFCLLAVLLPIKKASADAWGANYAAAIMKHTLEQIDRTIQGVMIGTAKQIAARMVHQTVGKLILGGNGGSGGPLYITNWNQYLYTDVANSANIVMNDFFTWTTRGANSAVNYAALQAEGITGSYANYLTRQAQETINGSMSRMDIQSYVSDPSQMFAQGNWRAFNAFVSNPANNPFGFTLMSQSVYQETLERERNKAEIQAIAYQGFKAQKSNGEVITPGSTIKDIQSQVENIGNNIIATAQHIPEIITATVIQTTTEIIRQGIGNAQRNVQREINNVVGGVRRDVNEAVQQSGPGTIFRSSY